MRFDGYIRVSATRGREGRDNFLSPEQQLEKIEGYAKLKGYEISEIWNEYDQSGRKEARPLFLTAIERVERGETDGIIVAKLDRFARSVLGAKRAIERIEKAGGKLVAVDNNFDTSTPWGRFGLTMMLAIAELESDRIRENWDDVQRRAVDRGVHIASKPPTGYLRVRDDRGVALPLEPDPEAAPVIKRAFVARAGGKASLREIAKMLNEAGIAGPYGHDKHHWTPSVVARLLRNPVYFGEARSGRYTKAGAHPAIVTRAEWEAAQTAGDLPSPHDGREGALLSGLLRCAGCRYLMKPDRMNDRDGSKLRLYRCRGEHAAGMCPLRPSTLGRVIEPYVIAQFFAAIGPGGVLARPVLAAAGEQTLEALEAQRVEATAERDYWLEHQSARKIGVDRYNRGLEAREEALAAVIARIAALESPSGLVGLPELFSLRDYWNEFTIKEQRYYLSLAFDALMLRGGRNRPIEERVHVLLRGELPDDFPRRGYRQNGIQPYRWPDVDEVDSRRSVAIA